MGALILAILWESLTYMLSGRFEIRGLLSIFLIIFSTIWVLYFINKLIQKFQKKKIIIHPCPYSVVNTPSSRGN